MRNERALLRSVCCLLCVAALGPRLAVGDGRLRGIELRGGDRVVLLGGTLIEREQQHGYWETLLAVAAAGRDITFRNLGWSGDTVWGESRGMFEPEQGYERLVEQVEAADPTLVLLAYGNNEAFAGEDRLDEFVAQYAKLLDGLKSEDHRFVLLSPLLMEADRLPSDPDATPDYVDAYNRQVGLYGDAIESLARDGRHVFVDLRPWQQRRFSTGKPPLTSNGLHLTDIGYRQTARWLAHGLSPLTPTRDVDFDTPAAQELRAAIVAKNRLFFHRWRPQNFTYLLGFRSYEQGQNAAEIARFDPLIEAAKRRISVLAEAVASTGGNEGNEVPHRQRVSDDAAGK